MKDVQAKTYSQRELEDALPAYIKGTLSSDVALQIEKLSAENAEFAALVLFEQQIAGALDGEQEYSPAIAPEHNFTRLKALIREEESKPSFLQSMFNWLKGPIPAAFSMGAFAIILVAIMPRETQQFETLSDSKQSMQVSEDARLMRVIFNTDLSEQELKVFSDRHSLELVKGPDTLGSYVFELTGEQAVTDSLVEIEKDQSVSFAGQTVLP